MALALLLSWLTCVTGLAGAIPPTGSATNPDGPGEATACLTAAAPVECLERTAPAEYPESVRGQVAQLAGLDPLGAPARIDPGEETYRAFLALFNADGLIPEEVKPAYQAGFQDYAESSFELRLASMELRLAQLDETVALLMADDRFWKEWAATDLALEAKFRGAHPQVEEIVRWRDPDVRVNALGWLIEELLRNASCLKRLGRIREAQRMLLAAEDFALETAGSGSVAGLLVGNTFARFLLAGWRDVDDPMAALESQKSRALANVSQVTRALKLSASAAGRPGTAPVSVWRTALRRAVVARRPWQAARPLLLALVPGRAAAARILALLERAVEHPRREHPADRHTPDADDIAYAMNLTLALAPPGEALDEFLARQGPSLPPGDAILLGAGDGAEPLRAAALGQLERIFAVDHSELAVARMMTMAARMARHTPLDRLLPVGQDVRAFRYDDSNAALVVSNHTLEYLSEEDRTALLKEIRAWLKPGGAFFLNVHLAQGERFDRLTGQYGNVSTQANASGTLVTISRLVPASPEAVQLQQFFTREGLLRELEQAGFSDGPESSVTDRQQETPAGFVELLVVAHRK
jgi:SAM-dependent methyltransferase